MNKKIFRCNNCEYNTSLKSNIKSHIVNVHGDFNCIKCNERLNITGLFKHEVKHLKEDILNGDRVYGQWDTKCCFCGNARDSSGFHYCDKIFLYNSYKTTLVKNPRGNVLKFSINDVKLDTYSKKIKKEYNNIILHNKNVRLCLDKVLPIPEKELQIKTNEDKIKLMKLRKMKKHRFTPKLPPKYDSDDNTDTDDE